MHVPAVPVGKHQARPWRQRDQVIEIIALFKFVLAAGLIALSFGSFKLLDPSSADLLKGWILALSETDTHPRLLRGLEIVADLGPRKFQVIGAAALFYAVLYIVEGFGLWYEKRWAEWLTVIATSLFIPLEIYEVIRHISIARVGAVVINVALVAYLIYRIRHPNERAKLV